ncbi:MAG: hypothetical protein K2G83_02505, partial [Ruminococcus sp.]|nr:hypothetical protein [Ruminococcus sp.]
MAENSVGTISLDLVIQNNITGQLEKIKSNAERPAKQIGESIESAIEVPIAKSAENIQEKLGSAFEGASKTVQKAAEKMTESFDNGTEEAVKRAEERLKKQEAELEKSMNTKPRSGSIDYAAIRKEQELARKEVDEYTENIGKKPIQAVDRQLELIFSKIKNFKIPTTPVERLETELESTRIKTDLLQKKWQELSAAEPSEKVISQMLKIQQQIISTQAASERLKSQLAELNKIDSGQSQAASGTKEVEKSWHTVCENIKLFFKNLLYGVRDICKVLFSLIKKECGELVSLLTTVLKGLKNTALAPVLAVVSGIKNIGKACDYAYEKIKYYLEHPLYAVRDAGKAAFSVIKKVGSKAFGVLKSVGGKALDSLKSRFGFLNKSAISLTKPIKKLGTTLKNTFRRVFIMATLYAVVKAIKNSFSEILKSNDELSKSLNDVKANLSIAFTPIIQAVMPALNTMMSGLAKVTRYIAGFTAGLFGTTYKQAAEATQKLKNTGKTATDTAKKVKLSLAGIDEMNILSDNSDESENDEESSGIDFSNLDMSEPELPDWAERLKNAIKAGDWYGVGEVLAEKVNSVFSGIDWENIEKKVTAGVNKICDFINGFADNINFEHLGNAFAGGLNTISSAVNTFSDNIHWETIGSGLANGLNQAVNKIKWKQLGRSISSNIRILTDLFYNFVTGFDWKNLGNGIGEAVNGWFDGIDFGKLATTFSEGIKGIFSTTAELLQTIDFSSIGNK